MNNDDKYKAHLCIAPVAANADWQHDFTCKSQDELRRKIALYLPRGPYTIQYRLIGGAHWVRIFNKSFTKPYVFTSPMMSQDDATFIWERVKIMDKVNTTIESKRKTPLNIIPLFG